MKKIILISLLSLVPMVSNAASIHGSGTLSCAEFNTYSDRIELGDSSVQWVLGFLSAISVYSVEDSDIIGKVFLKTDKKFASNFKNIKNDIILLSLIQTCKSNPAYDLTDATINIYHQLGGER